jgi:predicted metal-dependent hydrolase
MIHLPNLLELRSICEKWQIQYLHSSQQRITSKKTAPYELLIKGNIDYRPCLQTLQKWLKLKAKLHLGQWIQALSDDTNLHFTNITIRGQKSRWGSCSKQKNINLNYKLLFLPAKLVEHVLLHELCHTKQLNHSQQFWKLFANFDVQYKENRKLLRKADQYIPGWFRN